MPTTIRSILALTAALLVAQAASAQSLGTFTWRLEPYCNLVTVNVTQNGAIYTMDGYDDLCGGGRRAPLVGLATPNPDGSIGIGWNIVVDGVGIHLGGRITLGALSGPWSDSAGNSGHFVFGTATNGSPRPVPLGTSTIPPAFALLNDGGFLARGTLGTGTGLAIGSGTRMMWLPYKSAFRAGTVPGDAWNEANIGDFSTALGYDTTARGVASTALGDHTVAGGLASTAMGKDTNASGYVGSAFGFATNATSDMSTAMGSRTTASGPGATAMGYRTVASGGTSTAMGSESVASNDYATALGFRSTASGVSSTAMGVLTHAAALGSTTMGTFATAASTATGSFVYGDRSTVGNTTARITANMPNQFLVRAAGGVTFYTNGTLTSGVVLAGGGSGWGIVSDANMKENFRDLPAGDVLARIAAMPVREWNYKTQDASIRHVGPTAQDFHAAFGLGESDVRINTIDADGIALAAVKALEERTRMLAAENDDLRARLARLEALIDKR